MKKLIILSYFLLSTLPAIAQETASSNLFQQLHHKISRYITVQQKLPWVQAVQRRYHAATPTRSVEIKWDFLAPRQTPALAAGPHQKAKRYLSVWQQALRTNTVLGHFILKIPNPIDVETLSLTQANFLLRFLRNGTTVGTAQARYVPTKTEEFEHYLVRLTLQPAPQEKPLYLIANCYTRELFVSLSPQLEGLPLEPLHQNTFSR